MLYNSQAQVVPYSRSRKDLGDRVRGKIKKAQTQ